jgi:hypothetical protein
MTSTHGIPMRKSLSHRLEHLHSQQSGMRPTLRIRVGYRASLGLASVLSNAI